MNWQDRLSSDPSVCHGSMCIQGTRVMVSVILENLAEGESHQAIRNAYCIEEDDIQAVLHYAATLANEQILPLPLEAA